MRKFTILFIILFLGLSTNPVHAQTKSPFPTMRSIASDQEATDSAETIESEASPTPEPTPSPTPRPDFTQPAQETVLGPLEKILDEQELGKVWPANPIKYAIRGSVNAGVPPNTIVLLLLLPLIAAFIAAARHIIGLRGFGIFLPASLAVVFVAIGPILGIALFGIIVIVSTLFRIFLRKIRVRLQYLPRMSLILQLVALSVLSVLFAAPLMQNADLANVSIFPVLILALLAEDFSKVQIGKSARTAISLGTETIIMSLISYLFLTTPALQRFALLNPETLIIFVAFINVLLGKYIGLRFIEYWKYRKLILGK